MDSNPIHHPSPANKMKCSFLDYVQLLMISRAGQWNRTPSTSPLQPKKMKCYFLDYVQLLMISWACQWTWTPSTTCLQPKNEMLIFWLCSLQMIGRAGQWTWTPSTTLLQPKKWNPHFCITFNFWCWLDWSMDLKKNEMLVFGLCSLLMICLADWWTQTPSATPLLPKKWNAQFLITFNFWWSARLVNGPEPHPPPSPAKNMKCSFLDFVQLLMISQAGQWTRTPSATPLQPKKWNAHFCITINFWFRPDWSMDSNPIHHPSPTNKMKCLILDYAQLLMIDQAGWWTQTPSATLSSQKMKCSFLDYVQLLMINQAGQWTRTPSASPLQPIKWNAHIFIMFNFWWSTRLVNGLKTHLPPLSSQ